MLDTVSDVQDVAIRFGRRHCLLTSRGSSALFLALKAIEAERGQGEVIIPAMACLSLWQTISLAGFTPIVCDIAPTSFCLSPEAVRRRVGPSTKAILPVHMFGYPADMARICDIARQIGAAVIEDACHGPGGSIGERPMGSFGDFAILSFGGTKAIDLGAGGALLTDDDASFERCAELAQRLPQRPARNEFTHLSLSHRNFYHAAIDLQRVTPDAPVADALRAVTPSFGTWLVHHLDDYGRLQSLIRPKLAELDGANARRFERAERYNEILTDLPFVQGPLHSFADTRAVWRYSLLAETPELAASLSATLRASGLHASNHYWSLASLLQTDAPCPAASYAQHRIVNLWVDELVDDEYLERTRIAFVEWNRSLDESLRCGATSRRCCPSDTP